MCNITIETIKPIIDVFSAFLTPTIAICTGWFMWQQKEIQKNQQATEIFKLRNEHIKLFFDIWGNFHRDIIYIKGVKAQLIWEYNRHDEVISHMQKIIRELVKHNLSTEKLFNNDLYKKEEEMILTMRTFIPQYEENLLGHTISIEEYENNREVFEELYKQYQEIMNTEGKICN